MRVFDTVGVFIVAGWVAFTGVYVWHHESDGETTTVEQSQSVSLEEGERWMLLRRYDDDIGFIRRVTTRLTEGWLLEYEALVILDIRNRSYGAKAEFDARLDEEGVMTGFSANGEIAGQTISASGDIRDKTLHTTLQFGDQTRETTLDLQKTPRLPATRLRAIARDDSLKPGDRIRQSVFAPSRFGMQSVVVEVNGERTIDLVTRSAKGLYLEQIIGGNRYDIYIDERGAILLREFPFRIYGVHTNAEFASARAATLRKRLGDTEQLPDDTLEKMSGLLDTFGSGGAGGGLLPTGPMEILEGLSGGAPPANADRPDAGSPAPPPDTTDNLPKGSAR